MINFLDLQTKGYVVIPGFLDATELARLQDDYTNIKATTTNFANKNYQVLLTRDHKLNDLINATLDKVREFTDLTVDTITPGATYFDNSLIDFTWHQDHEPYYIQQESYHGLNFWIPLIKPNSNTSGLSVVPYDRLPESTRALLVGRGAKQFTCHNNTTLVADDESGKQWTIDLDLNSIAESPSMLPGDLLLMRHDVIHCTQLGEDLRVAMSVRCYNGESMLTRTQYFGGCFKKQAMIKNNTGVFKHITNKFNRDNLSKFQLKILLAELGKK